MFKAITPSFIHKIDAWLLKNYPAIWISKIHYVLWHGGVFWLISTLLGFILPFDLQNGIEYGLFYFLFSIGGFALLCFWIYQYVIFNKEKNYGLRSITDEYLNFFLAFVSVAIFLMSPYPFESVYRFRVANTCSNQEIINDLNTINESAPYALVNAGLFNSTEDSLGEIRYVYIKNASVHGAGPFTPYYMSGDSLKYPYLLTKYQLYKRYKPVNDSEYVFKMIRNYLDVCRKYEIEVKTNAYTMTSTYLDLLKKSKVQDSEIYNLATNFYTLEKVMDNICEAKFKTPFVYEEDFLWFMFYSILSITSFLLLFKLTSWRQFLVMFVVLIFYPMIVSIISALVPSFIYDNKSALIQGFIVAAIVFSLIIILINYNNHKQYEPFFNVCSQVFYVMLPYFFFIVVFFLNDATNLFHKQDYWYSDYTETYVNDKVVDLNNILNSLLNEYWRQEYYRWILYGQWGGILLFVGAQPLLKHIFVKQLALPKKT
jgi:hypothetical protein